MIGHLFYLCPLCSSEDCLIEKSDALHCQNCQHSFPFTNNLIEFDHTLLSISDFYALIRQKLKLYPSGEYRIGRLSSGAVLRQGIKRIRFRASDGSLYTIEKPLPIDRGRFQLTPENITFNGTKKKWIFPKKEILGYTTNSKYFEFKVRGQPFFQIYFENESPLKYEELLSLWFSTAEGESRIIEHQPRITLAPPEPPPLLLSFKEIENEHNREKFGWLEYLLHLFIGLPVTRYLKWRAGLIYLYGEIIPREGPFVLIMNHESYLDPILISTLACRRIAFFTKSTSFADRLLQPVFRAYRSMPNRRYEIDPMVVRQGLRCLKKGNCLGIFPEGERTWDGKLLPFKWTSIRFLQSVQVPIVLVKIEGAFSLLPRWSHHLRKGTMRIKVLSCFSLLAGKWTTAELKSFLETCYLSEKK